VAERRHLPEETRTGETHPRPLTAEQFEAQPEFERFKEVMRRIIMVSKSEIDARVERARENSPRANNPNSPGRKPTKRLRRQR
jgi:hypothetical protein